MNKKIVREENGITAVIFKPLVKVCEGGDVVWCIGELSI